MGSMKVLVLINLFHLISSEDSNLLIETTSGKIQGHKLSPEGFQPYYAFEGIPYAEPPVRNLRFKAPVPKKKWSNILDGTKEKSMCIQSSGEGSEDCLYLNIYAPKIPSDGNKLPVMVWIHGGGFVDFSGSLKTLKPDFFLEKNVIVISMNYRLGVFGFLAFGDKVIPGNFGLKDQVLALKWIKKNVKKFGGDPERITVFGESAGSASISYLLQTEKTKGLFHRAIMQSGVSLCLWSYCRIASDLTKKIAGNLKINSKNSTALLIALQKLSTKELSEASSAVKMKEILTHNLRDGLFTGPVIEPESDQAIVTEKSYELLKKGGFHKIPIIVGHNSMEGMFDLSGPVKAFMLQYDLFPARLVPADMNLKGLAKINAGLKIKKKFFDLGLAATSDEKLLKFLSDDQFNRPTREYVRLWSKYSKAYFYIFGYEGALGGNPNPGVSHAEELNYFWNVAQKGTENDYLTRQKMIQMWTDFAKTGNPTPNKMDLLNNVIWQPNFKNNQLKVLWVNTTLEMKENSDKNIEDFWTALYKTSKGTKITY